jgi:DNA polymerase I-like protein with 3'-5' exonuclease and polymerase domains
MKIRKTFLADKGRILLFIDLSRVEDRIVQMYSGIWGNSPRMIALANDRMTDTHAENALAIMGALGVEPEQGYEMYKAFLKDKHSAFGQEFGVLRQKAKKVTHGVQRALGAKGLSTRFFQQDGLSISPKVCQKMINAYLKANWEIRDFYFPSVENLIRRDGGLVNAFGRRIDWTTQRVNNALFRKAYSWLPQSECADLMNTQGIVRGHAYCAGKKSKLLAQKHDEAIFSCVPKEAYDLAKYVVGELEKPYTILRQKLSVPADLAIGSNWADEREFKGFPTRGVFEREMGKLL